MKDCIFCKIVAGEIPSDTVYENDRFKVILDLNQRLHGHMLVIPKVHYDDLFELPEEIAAEAMVVAKRISSAAKSLLQCEGLNLLQNNGKIADQSVMHFHLHVMPRAEGDSVFPRTSEQGDEVLSLPLEARRTLCEGLSREAEKVFQEEEEG